jgi:hypothetical protein
MLRPAAQIFRRTNADPRTARGAPFIHTGVAAAHGTRTATPPGQPMRGAPKNASPIRDISTSKELSMKRYALNSIAMAIALAFAASASAAGTTSSTNTKSDAMKSPSDKSAMPAACEHMTGNELGQCLKEHGGAMDKGSGAMNGGMANDRTNPRMRNDKSGSGSGSVGAGTTAGPTGAAGAGGTSAGTAGTTGASGSAGTSGGGGK